MRRSERNLMPSQQVLEGAFLHGVVVIRCTARLSPQHNKNTVQSIARLFVVERLLTSFHEYGVAQDSSLTSVGCVYLATLRLCGTPALMASTGRCCRNFAALCVLNAYPAELLVAIGSRRVKMGDSSRGDKSEPDLRW
jgi:hypothetical protein